MASRRLVAALLALCLVSTLAAAVTAQGSDSVVDEDDAGAWDKLDLEPSQTAKPPQQHQQPKQPQPDAAAPDQKAKAAAQQPQRTPPPRVPRKPFDINDYKLETLAVMLIALYVLQITRGRNTNQELALAWARTFAKEGAVLERNFALLGPDENAGPDILVKQHGAEFQLYASGRRYCQAVMFTLRLRKRQDMLALTYYLVFPRQDELQVEVTMNEASMPPIVLAIAPPKAAKELAKEAPDIATFARKIEISRERCPSWPGDRLAVYAEHSSVFYELMPEPLLDQIFNRATWDEVGRYFKYLHFTSEGHLQRKDADLDSAQTSQKPRNMLKFGFALPPADRMDDLGKLMNMVMNFIDIVGTFKLSPDMQKRAEKVRQEYEEREWRQAEKERMEAMQEKKFQKKQEEKEKAKQMSPEAYAKWQERQRKVEMKRAQRSRIKKI